MVICKWLDKKINILDFKILKDSGGYDFPDGFGIVFYYALDEKNSYKGTLSASLKDDTVFHTEIKSDDWDDKDDYHFQSLFSFMHNCLN